MSYKPHKPLTFQDIVDAIKKLKEHSIKTYNDMYWFIPDHWKSYFSINMLVYKLEELKCRTMEMKYFSQN